MRADDHAGGLLVAMLGTLAFAGCNAVPTAAPPSTDGVDASLYQPERLPPRELPADPTTVDRVCERGHRDTVTRALCTSPRPTIRSLVDLERVLGLDPDSADFALNAASTSLVARATTSLNPRIILYGRVGPEGGDPIALGFVRGEPFAEIVGSDGHGGLNFYLFSFGLECDSEPEGCGRADLLGPWVESEWTSWGLYQDLDLVNTPVDCLVCHQPGGPSTRRVLRMQELRAPWLHWFPAAPMAPSESEMELSAAFVSAHPPDERYGGVLVSRIALPSAADGSNLPGGANALESFVVAASDPFPIDHPGDVTADPPPPQGFDSFRVLEERDRGERTTWEAYRREARTGQRLPVPYFDVDPSDPEATALAAASYRAVVLGESPRSEMPDLITTLPREARIDLGFEPALDEDPASMVRHFCGRCHNSTLDQTLSRARFNALDLARSAPTALETAAARVQLPEDSPLVMPPRRFATLPPQARDALSAYLAGEAP